MEVEREMGDPVRVVVATVEAEREMGDPVRVEAERVEVALVVDIQVGHHSRYNRDQGHRWQ